MPGEVRYTGISQKHKRPAGLPLAEEAPMSIKEATLPVPRTRKCSRLLALAEDAS
jgi:hypothetical protein